MRAWLLALPPIALLASDPIVRKEWSLPEASSLECVRLPVPRVVYLCSDGTVRVVE